MSNIFTKIADLARAVAGKPPLPQKTAAIVLAAGASSRMGGEIPKQLMEICEKPVVIHSLLAFEKADYISEIILVVPEGCERDYRVLAKSYGISKISSIVSGGETRNKSAQCLELLIKVAMAVRSHSTACDDGTFMFPKEYIAHKRMYEHKKKDSLY